jgi:hypothetical protein
MVEEFPEVIEVGEAERETDGAPGAGVETVTVSVSLTVPYEPVQVMV